MATSLLFPRTGTTQRIKSPSTLGGRPRGKQAGAAPRGPAPGLRGSGAPRPLTVQVGHGVLQLLLLAFQLGCLPVQFFLLPEQARLGRRGDRLEGTGRRGAAGHRSRKTESA